MNAADRCAQPLRLLLLPFLVSAALTGCRTAAPDSSFPDSGVAAITDTLRRQAAAWNRGDIEAFMSAYEPSEALRFASGGDVTRGWKATLERYRKGYPDSAAMGTLTFSDLEITPMGSDGAAVFGRWRLVREKDSPSGLFTLTLRRGPDGWRILQDHTSSAAKP